ncbi:MAG: RidA family protein [Chloroflexota bacterium]|nr:RidA family protein [Chloroflexota bacterium]
MNGGGMVEGDDRVPKHGRAGIVPAVEPGVPSVERVWSLPAPAGRMPAPRVREWPLAVRAGQFLFLSGLLPVKADSGEMVAGYDDIPADARWLETGSLLADALQERTAAQIWLLYERLGDTLERLGSSKAGILLLNGWLTDFRQWPVLNGIRKRAFPPEAYPVSTTFQASGLNAPGAAALFEAIALAEGPLKRLPIGSAEQVGAYFPGSKVGPFIFLAGEVPADPVGPVIVRGYDDLDPEGRKLATGQIGPDGWEGRIRAQAWFVYRRLAKTLEAVGSSLAHIVKQNIYLRDPRDYPAVEEIGRMILGEKMPATMVVAVEEYGHREFLLEVEVTAVEQGSVSIERVESSSCPSLGPGFPAAIQAGQFLFISGQLPVPPGGRRVVAGGRTKAELAELQTAQIYRSVLALLRERGLGADALARQVIFFSDPATASAIERVARHITGSAPPATTMVQVPALWPEPSLVQIDFTAAVRP